MSLFSSISGVFQGPRHPFKYLFIMGTGSVAGPTATAADALSSVVKNNYTFTKLSYWALQFSNLHALHKSVTYINIEMLRGPSLTFDQMNNNISLYPNILYVCVVEF